MADRSVRLLTDAAWRKPLLEGLPAYAETTRRDAIARRHVDLYASVLHKVVAPAA